MATPEPSLVSDAVSLATAAPRVSYAFARSHGVFPLHDEGDAVLVVARDDASVEGIAELKRVLHDLGRSVRFVFRHFPMGEQHPHAQSAAEVAEAAGTQGKFWEMHDLLFQRQGALDDGHLLGYVRELGLDAERVERELERQVHRARVLEDIASGLRSGVSGTPMFFINGRRHEEPGDARTLRAALLRAT